MIDVDLERLIELVDSLLLNFDRHLELDHGQEMKGYDSETHEPATIRFYLKNIHESLLKLKKKVRKA
jgi:hypothetical protein